MAARPRRQIAKHAIMMRMRTDNGRRKSAAFSKSDADNVASTSISSAFFLILLVAILVSLNSLISILSPPMLPLDSQTVLLLHRVGVEDFICHKAFSKEDVVDNDPCVSKPS